MFLWFFLFINLKISYFYNYNFFYEIWELSSGIEFLIIKIL